MADPLAASGDAANTSFSSSDPTTGALRCSLWVEFELVDEEGQAIPNEPYWLRLPDGRRHHGRLDARGRAHVEVDVGDRAHAGRNVVETCHIGFPELDDEDWEEQ